MVHSSYVSSFMVILAYVVACFAKGTSASACVWCDHEKSEEFMTCFCQGILNSPSFGADYASGLDDMKSSIIAASAAMKTTNAATRTMMMTGALSGEVAEMIKSRYKSSPLNSDAIAEEMMHIIGTCYDGKSDEKHHQDFTQLFVKTVKFLLSYQEQTDDTVTSTMFQTKSNSGYDLNSLGSQYSAQVSSDSSSSSTSNFNTASNMNNIPNNVYNEAKQGTIEKPSNIPDRYPSNVPYYPNTYTIPQTGTLNGVFNNPSNNPFYAPDQDKSSNFVRGYAYPSNRVINQPPYGPNFIAQNPNEITSIYADRNFRQQTDNRATYETIPADQQSNLFVPQPGNNFANNRPYYAPWLYNQQPIRATYPHNIPASASSSIENTFTASARLFYSTIFKALLENIHFKTMYTEQITKDDVLSITLHVLTRALKGSAYFELSNSILNYCTSLIQKLPANCPTEMYGEAIAKCMLIQLYKNGRINNAEQQATGFANAFLSELEKLLSKSIKIDQSPGIQSSNKGSIPIDSENTLSESVPTNSVSNFASASSDDSETVSSISKSSRKTASSDVSNSMYSSSARTLSSSENPPNTPASASSSIKNTSTAELFYKTVFNAFLENTNFNRIYDKQITKDYVMSITSHVLTRALEKSGYSELSNTILNYFTSLIQKLPANSPTEMYGEAIAKCMLIQLYKNGRINNGGQQATDFANAFLSELETLLSKSIKIVQSPDIQSSNKGSVPINSENTLNKSVTTNSVSSSANASSDDSETVSSSSANASSDDSETVSSISVSTSGYASKNVSTSSASTLESQSNVHASADSSFESVSSAKSFYSTIFNAFLENIHFKTMYHEQITKDDVISITSHILMGALEDCGYLEFSNKIVNYCTSLIQKLPANCPSKMYGAAIAKCMLIHLYKNGKINNAKKQATDFAKAFLVHLEKHLSESTKSRESHDIQSSIADSTPSSSANGFSDTSESVSSNSIRSSISSASSAFEKASTSSESTLSSPESPSNMPPQRSGFSTSNTVASSSADINSVSQQRNNVFSSSNATASSVDMSPVQENAFPSRNAAAGSSVDMSPVPENAFPSRNAAAGSSAYRDISQSQESADTDNSQSQGSAVVGNDFQQSQDTDLIELNKVMQKLLLKAKSYLKQRVRMLIKTVLLSISSHEFDYKQFSKFISAIVKYIQKRIFDTSSTRNVLMRVLIKSLKALSQLFMRVKTWFEPSRYLDNNCNKLKNTDESSYAEITNLIQENQETENAVQLSNPQYLDSPQTAIQDTNLINETPDQSIKSQQQNTFITGKEITTQSYINNQQQTRFSMHVPSNQGPQQKIQDIWSTNDQKRSIPPQSTPQALSESATPFSNFNKRSEGALVLNNQATEQENQESPMSNKIIQQKNKDLDNLSKQGNMQEEKDAGMKTHEKEEALLTNVKPKN